MPASSASPASSPRLATVGFGSWLVASVLLMAGGMMVTGLTRPGVDVWLIRGIGALTALAGLAMACAAGRSRSGGRSGRRAAMAVSAVVAVVVFLTMGFGVVHILTVFGMLLLIAGAGLNAWAWRGDRGE